MTNGDSKNSKVFKKSKKWERKTNKKAWYRNLNSICIPVSPRPDYPVLQGRAWRSLASDAPRRGHEGCIWRMWLWLLSTWPWELQSQSHIRHMQPSWPHREKQLKLSYVMPCLKYWVIWMCRHRNIDGIKVSGSGNFLFLNLLDTFEFFESPFGINIDRHAWECRKTHLVKAYKQRFVFRG